MASTLGAANPFRYRGYYYDTETGFYYLNSRYYDPVVGRFINADVIIGANGGIMGYNMFAYCLNNPVNTKDATVTTPDDGNPLTGMGGLNLIGVGGGGGGIGSSPCRKIVENIDTIKEAVIDGLESLGTFVDNVAESFFASFEIEGGWGTGWGVEVEGGVEVGGYQDWYIGCDDGELVAGNMANLSLEIGPFGYDETYMHEHERAGYTSYCDKCYENPTMWGLATCSHSVHSIQKSIGPISIGSDGSISIGGGASFHFLLGGHINASFNVSEYHRRLADCFINLIEGNQ